VDLSGGGGGAPWPQRGTAGLRAGRSRIAQQATEDKLARKGHIHRRDGHPCLPASARADSVDGKPTASTASRRMTPIAIFRQACAARRQSCSRTSVRGGRAVPARAARTTRARARAAPKAGSNIEPTLVIREMRPAPRGAGRTRARMQGDQQRARNRQDALLPGRRRSSIRPAPPPNYSDAARATVPHAHFDQSRRSALRRSFFGGEQMVEAERVAHTDDPGRIAAIQAESNVEVDLLRRRDTVRDPRVDQLAG
jgi:hypothetical protein